MTSTQTYDLPYQKDPVQLFELVRYLPWAQLLDSGNCKGQRGRYDIITADPYLKISASENYTIVTERDGDIIETGHEPFGLIRQQMYPFHQERCEIPFCGGVLGYFGYDLEIENQSVKDKRPDIADLPDMALGVYDWAIITDHEKQQTYFVSAGNDNFVTEQTRIKFFNDLTKPPSLTDTLIPLEIERLETDTSLDDYQAGFDQIQHYLVEGDCYQINYARRFNSHVQGSPWESYKLLRKANPVPFGAYLEFPFAQFLSSSPERFIHVSGNKVETRPIKGTRPRSTDPAKDNKLKMELASSEKDRAENLMIVDLLRNDLGKSCRPGSIKVPELFSVEAYPTVFHLVSSIVGTIASNKTAVDVLQDCFPGGSITGAPKKRAMEIIRELEKHQRGVYCGAIGYISFNGNMDTNIAIRTITISQNELSFWSGGGIVADSDVNEEFQETQDKARAFFRLLSVDDKQLTD